MQIIHHGCRGSVAAVLWNAGDGPRGASGSKKVFVGALSCRVTKPTPAQYPLGLSDADAPCHGSPTSALS